MEWQDIGARDAEVLIFGGPYSNLPATRALIARAGGRGIDPQAMICTGDIVAYCGEPSETVAEIRRLNAPVVAGNCELQLASGQMDCGCGFDAGTTCDVLSAGWFAHVDRHIGAEDRAWMNALPQIITFHHQGMRCAVIHGGVSDVSRFIWETDADAVFDQELDLLKDIVGQVDIVFAGHSGIAFSRQIGDVTWVNAGVIGMPPNAGSPRTQFVTLKAGHVRIESLSYDHAAARSMMQVAGLTQGYDLALSTGWWPSEEVLPSDLRRSALDSG